jgi:lycopene cyclase domain-containing protein
MGQFSYLAVLGFIFSITLLLELILKARVWQKFKRLLLTVIPVMAAMTLWDWYAIKESHWFFNSELTSGVILFGFLPLEEFLFFFFVPIAALLTFEAVRSIKGDRVTGEQR